MDQEFKQIKEQSDRDIIQHINRVRELLDQVCKNLLTRAINHDRSKTEEPEASLFAACNAQLRGMTYGSEEYMSSLRDCQELKQAIDHHYAHNTHHPEHFETRMAGMTLLDVIEMFCDWKAATERHADGDIVKSIKINKKRFGYSDMLEQIFLNTVKELRY